MPMTLRELKRLLRERVTHAGGIRAFGRAHGIRPSRISEALGSRSPTPQVLRALGLRKVHAVYERVTP